ncbi:hypothetical protein IQ249_13665 [Lusitaniella coriacea LEGE 07157]|uniref:Tetratricopeptide repeat protein n=1 Tax=Lusitaniella coriacea LEGE 07157 TaxID=945747 RepID=A0A8J7JBF6_9CYAN|nr:hypothetical protein [Lusitaniella coriacea]MBE9116950.1 hypothetical protein [Lusitaniella coriacea LEGE 07157]
MNILIRGLNAISGFLLGAGVIDLWRKGTRSRKEAEQAEQCARSRQFMRAFVLGGDIIDSWYPARTKGKRWFRRWVLGRFLKALRGQLAEWEPLAEREYDSALQRARWLATEGRFEEAIALLDPVNRQFYHPEGTALLNKVRQIVEGRNCFRLGLLAEKGENFEVACQHYDRAISFAPEWGEECAIRQGIVAIKTQNWAEAIARVQGIKGERAAYVRGFAWAQQGNYQKAYLEWQGLKDSEIQAQREMLDGLRDRERYLLQRQIQQQVEAGDFLAAESLCRDVLQKWGDDPRLQYNLKRHIKPHSYIQLWQGRDWSQVAQVAESDWHEQRTIETLHNWAIAADRLAFIDPHMVKDWLVIFACAIANIHLDPSLHNVPWLQGKPLNLKEVAATLWQRTEARVSALQESHPTQYEDLQEVYRLESVALDWMGQPPRCGLQVRGLFVTPGYYQRDRQYFPSLSLPGELWATLYTPWWQSILACLDGNPVRALQVKPNLTPASTAEEFAQKFVAYHEGSYYLKPGGYPRWREAIAPLTLACDEIEKNGKWRAEINRLCEQQCQTLTWNGRDRQELAQFWYDLTNSPIAQLWIEREE